MGSNQDFYNTIGAAGPELRNRISEASSQSEKVRIFFQDLPGHKFTPREVWEIAFGRSCELTSVRRSITTLTKEGFLEKTTDQKKEVKGAPNYKWTLFIPVPTTKQLNFDL